MSNQALAKLRLVMCKSQNIAFHKKCVLIRQLNAMEYRSLNRRGAISFPENSRWKSIISFIRKGRKNNHDKAIIIALDNLKSHKVAHVKADAKGLGIGLVFLIPYPPTPNPIESIINRVISTTFVRHVNDMRNIIK